MGRFFKDTKKKVFGSLDPPDVSQGPTPVIASSAAAPVGPSILSLPAVVITHQKLSDDTEILQSSTTRRSRVGWAIKDRGAFLQAVKELRESNDLLESLLNIQSLEHPTQRHSPLGTGIEPPTETLDVKEPLEQLHLALIEANGSDSTKCLAFGIKLAYNHRATKDDVEKDGHDLDLRPNSYCFYLQAHMVDGWCYSKYSRGLLVETPQAGRIGDADLNNVRQQVQVKTLRQALVLGGPRPGEGFRFLGGISHPSSNNMHYVFQGMDGPGGMKETLEDLLHDAGFNQHQYIKGHIGLAFILAISHLHFASINLPSPSHRPKNYYYYDGGNETTDGQDKDKHEEDVLSPYLFAGFGSKVKKQSTHAIGRRSGARSSASTSIIELGLLLHQIGCWKPLTYRGGSSGLADLKTQAVAKLPDVDRRVGLIFSEVVGRCLDWRKQYQGNQESERAAFYELIVRPLKELSDELLE